MPEPAHAEGIRVANLLSSKIRESRLSIRTIEELVGWGQASLNQVLTGQTPIRFSHVAAVCAVLNLPLGEFYRELAGGQVGAEAAFRGQDRRDRPAAPLEADRLQVPALWEKLASLPTEERRAKLEADPELHQWSLCEWLCEESIKVAPESADRALELAELALRVAELSPGEEPWRQRLQGYAWAHVGNAQRVRDDLRRAEEAFARANQFWQDGAIAGSGFLDESRVPGLEASLRRDQEHFQEAFDLLDRALAALGERQPSSERRDRKVG